MKCGQECDYYIYKSCDFIEESVQQGDDCHCDPERVARLLEQVPEVLELLRELVDEMHTRLTCADCSRYDAHWCSKYKLPISCPGDNHACGGIENGGRSKYLITRARALVGGGE